MLDLDRLRSFAEVAERGTVAAAAASLGYTPPAVSQHIAKLEHELDASLFDRAGGRLRLTLAGRALLPIAHELADLEARARAVVAEPPGRPRYVVAGFASAIAAILVPRLAEIETTMDLEIIESEDAEALRELALGTVDLVLVQEYDDPPLRHQRFAYTPVVVDELRLVLPAHASPATRVADLAHVTWLLNGRDTRCSRATELLLAERGIAPHIGAVVSDNTTLLALVAAGHGVTVIPSLVVDETDADVVIADERLGVRRTIHAVTRRATRAAVQPLLDTLV